MGVTTKVFYGIRPINQNQNSFIGDVHRVALDRPYHAIAVQNSTQMPHPLAWEMVLCWLWFWDARCCKPDLGPSNPANKIHNPKHRMLHIHANNPYLGLWVSRPRAHTCTLQ